VTHTVSALRERPRGRVEVELDGEAWRTLPAEAVVRSGLAVGRTLDRETARELARELRRARALSRALRTLSARDRSRGEIDARLEQAGVPESARAEALKALERGGLVDDARMAAARAGALARRGYGNAAIRVDLLRRRVPEEAVVSALEALEPESERAAALLDGARDPRAALRRLAARGFDRDVVEDLSRFAQEA
jgi:SOS response regulatory protein OraA/RecX